MLAANSKGVWVCIGTVGKVRETKVLRVYVCGHPGTGRTGAT